MRLKIFFKRQNTGHRRVKRVFTGFTLVEVMIAMGVASVLLVAVGNITTNLLKTQANFQNNTDFTSLNYFITSLSGSPTFCTTAFTGINPVPSGSPIPPGPPPPVINPGVLNDIVVYNLGPSPTPMVSPSLRFGSVMFTSSQIQLVSAGVPDQGNTKYIAQLVVQANKSLPHGQNYGGQSLINNTTYLSVDLNASNQLVSCSVGAAKPNQPAMGPPGGRLTIISKQPVPVFAQNLDNSSISTPSPRNTLFYTPYINGFVPLYYGGSWNNYPFSEISMNISACPLPNPPTGIYDVYLFLDANGTVAMGFGNWWTSRTPTTLPFNRTNNGLLTNSAAVPLITGATPATILTTIPAGNGLYVGSITTNGSVGTSNLLTMSYINDYGSTSTITPMLSVYNAYNQVPTSATVVSPSNLNWWVTAPAPPYGPGYSDMAYYSSCNQGGVQILDGLGASLFTANVSATYTMNPTTYLGHSVSFYTWSVYNSFMHYFTAQVPGTGIFGIGSCVSGASCSATYTGILSAGLNQICPEEIHIPVPPSTVTVQGINAQFTVQTTL